MKYGICHLSVVPCRFEPSDRSEMVTQLLFGETVKIYEEKKGDWRRIKTAFDDYDCWVDKKQITEIPIEEFDDINGKSRVLSGELVHVIHNKSTEEFIPIVLGSFLPNYNKNKVSFNVTDYIFDGLTFDTSKESLKNKLVENAYLYLNTPYLWGGRSPFGIDCSGFTQLLYKLNGVKLPRDASQQAKVGQTLSFVEESEAGDLAFFDNEEGNIIHVGMVLENNRIIHASGKVRIDRLDHQGIYNVDTNKYSHRLRLIKKIL
ncbi:MAG: C40 family peptidase [Flavobacteriales bacterium]|nr:C40 family peptidase [Flavobacteriales bacterium]